MEGFFGMEENMEAKEKLLKVAKEIFDVELYQPFTVKLKKFEVGQEIIFTVRLQFVKDGIQLLESDNEDYDKNKNWDCWDERLLYDLIICPTEIIEKEKIEYNYMVFVQTTKKIDKNRFERLINCNGITVKDVYEMEEKD